MNYTVLILPGAQKEHNSIPSPFYELIEQRLLSLRNNPRPPGCKKLRGRDGWRVRAGDYRIVYDIDDSRHVVTVVAICHRKDVYR